ncbi:MAG TPA: NADP-dependent oxidoreductase [Ktedonobacterales bacterium]|nr:NADP-dependent oxidoreductase [Ktedonobacterales bacterium]
MRTIAIDDFGAAPTLHELPTPEPGAGEVLIHVQTSSVNGFDLAVAGGMIRGLMEHQFPLVLGRDFAGTVVATGPATSRFAVGDAVFGVVFKPVLHDGAFGEFVTMPEVFGVTLIPAGLDMTRAGVLGLAGSAARMAVDAVAPSAGERVLISGATGGVGAYAIQMVAASGAEVIATARPGAEADFVRGLGAADTINYTQDVLTAVRSQYPDGVQAVIHLAGDGLRLIEALVPSGRIASTLLVNPDAFAGHDVRATGVVASFEPARLERLAGEVVSGRLCTTIERTYPLEDVARAFADFAAGTRGKLAVTIS